MPQKYLKELVLEYALAMATELAPYRWFRRSDLCHELLQDPVVCGRMWGGDPPSGQNNLQSFFNSIRLDIIHGREHRIIQHQPGGHNYDWLWYIGPRPAPAPPANAAAAAAPLPPCASAAPPYGAAHGDDNNQPEDHNDGGGAPAVPAAAAAAAAPEPAAHAAGAIGGDDTAGVPNDSGTGAGAAVQQAPQEQAAVAGEGQPSGTAAGGQAPGAVQLPGAAAGDGVGGGEGAGAHGRDLNPVQAPQDAAGAEGERPTKRMRVSVEVVEGTPFKLFVDAA